MTISLDSEKHILDHYADNDVKNSLVRNFYLHSGVVWLLAGRDIDEDVGYGDASQTDRMLVA